jgi:hypothetical protein
VTEQPPPTQPPTLTRRRLLQIGGAGLGLVVIGAGIPLALRLGSSGIPDEFAPLNGPLVFTSREDLWRARALVDDGQRPQVDVWVELEELARFDPTHSRMAPSADPDKVVFRAHGMRANVHALAAALRFALADDEEAAERAATVLRRWSRHGLRSDAAGEWDPGGSELPGQGLAVANNVIRFGSTYPLLHRYLSPSDRADVEAYFALNGRLIEENIVRWEDEGYYGGQQFNNHTTAHAVGLAVVAAVTGDEALLDDAMSGAGGNPQHIIGNIGGGILTGPDDEPCPYDRDPEPEFGEVYDRCQRRIGLVKAMLQLRMLVLGAEVALHNDYGVDVYRYETADGESLTPALEYYAPFFEERDPSIKTGYYSNELELPLKPALEVLQIAARRIPGMAQVEAAIAANADLLLEVPSDLTHFGPTVSLSHGAPV